jgi:DNA recombination protein RmuC
MDFILGLTLLNLGGILCILWLIFSKKSTSVNTQEISTPIIEQITNVFEYRFNGIKSEFDREGQKNIEMRTGLEARMGEIKNSLLEESNKSLQLQARTMSEIQQRIQTQLTEAVNQINQQNKLNFDTLAKTNHEKLTQIQGEVDKRLTQSFEQHLKSFETVNKNIGEMQSTAQKMMDSTKSIDKLNTIFDRTNSKGFGQFSETYLESLLSQHLNVKDWQKQVSVPGSNDKIDFVISIGDKKIGIDSKFPITRYQDYIDSPSENKQQLLKEFFKSVQLMATDISKKYLQPGFVDTLLMFLPSDGMYSDIVNNQDMMNQLHKLKVTPISPATLFPIIVIVNSYEFRLKVNENAEMIMKGLQGVRKNVDSFREEFRKLGDKIRQAGENYDKADRNLIGLQNNILKLEAQEIVEEQKLLEM